MKRTTFLSAALLLVVAFVWVGCTSDQQPFAPAEQPAISAAKPVSIGAVMAVQHRHTPDLMKIRGVVGTATGHGPEDRPVVLVLTREPGVAGIPASLEGVRVIPKVVGVVRALPKPDKPGKPPTDDPPEPTDPTARQERPVPTGVSTGHPGITAGTIGCRVTDGANVYALSNNHVYAAANDAAIGDNVLQPGAFDGGVDPDDAIGTLADFEPIDFDGGLNTIDAAIALSLTSLLGNATPAEGYGLPKVDTIPATINMPVMKYGRTTGFTKGQRMGLGATVDVWYDQEGTKVARFVNQIIINPGSFSAGGDSGSLVVADGRGRTKADKRKPVGLLFAGSDFYTFANPIDVVLDRFGVSIDGE